MRLSPARRRYRTVFLSDIHLGTRACRADLAADFLHRTECERLFLVGEILDGWRLRKAWHWDRDHDEVIRRIVAIARDGADVTYVPGNHDEMLRDWLGLELAGVRILREAEHETADGRRFLLNDGDWVENCTALVEHEDGRFELLDWAREVASRERRAVGRTWAEPLRA